MPSAANSVREIDARMARVAGSSTAVHIRPRGSCRESRATHVFLSIHGEVMLVVVNIAFDMRTHTVVTRQRCEQRQNI
jgi:hypothetical protein